MQSQHALISSDHPTPSRAILHELTRVLWKQIHLLMKGKEPFGTKYCKNSSTPGLYYSYQLCTLLHSLTN